MNQIDPGLVALLIIAPMVLLIIVQCYVAHKYTERLEAMLTNCSFVIGNKQTFQHAGLLGKVMRTGLISVMLAVPKLFRRRGLIDVDEVQRFPPRLKGVLVGLLSIEIVLFAALVVSHNAQPVHAVY
ncbi:hypothetical protein ACIQUF_01215 [Pseudomonas sp. NPDC090233]|uniref:hypothetical protein n=1 Tax=Pseudomonas sp. NPDC090233 TaxID=3364479 RepID=UPI00383BC3CD